MVRHGIGVRIAGMPSPAGEATALRIDAAKGRGDSVGVDRKAKENAGPSEVVLLDLPGSGHAAPAGGASGLGDGVGQGSKTGINDMAPQGLGQGLGSTRCIAEAKAGTGQAEPCLAHIMFCGDLAE